MPIRREAIFSFCCLRIIDLHQTAGGDLRHEHLGDQSQSLIKWRIDTGNHQQEHKQQHEIDLSGKDHTRTCKDRCCYAKAHDHAGCIDKNTGGQFTFDHGLFVVIDLRVQLIQEPLFLVCSPDLPDVFEGFLNAVRHPDTRCFCDL